MSTVAVQIRNRCPRCNGPVLPQYDEPACLQCGFVDYTSPTPAVTRKSTSILNTATRYILRYVGDASPLANRLTTVHVKRVSNRVAYGVGCPFCGENMEQSSPSGRRRELREERFKCREGHRVSLVPDSQGFRGWK